MNVNTNSLRDTLRFWGSGVTVRRHAGGQDADPSLNTPG